MLSQPSNNKFNVTFPISFSNASTISISFAQAGNASGSINRLALSAPPTATGFYVDLLISSMIPAYWIALGY